MPYNSCFFLRREVQQAPKDHLNVEDLFRVSDLYKSMQQSSSCHRSVWLCNHRINPFLQMLEQPPRAPQNILPFCETRSTIPCFLVSEDLNLYSFWSNPSNQDVSCWSFWKQNLNLVLQWYCNRAHCMGFVYATWHGREMFPFKNWSHCDISYTHSYYTIHLMI